jgi:hypothetical protein
MNRLALVLLIAILLAPVWLYDYRVSPRACFLASPYLTRAYVSSDNGKTSKRIANFVQIGPRIILFFEDGTWAIATEG